MQLNAKQVKDMIKVLHEDYLSDIATAIKENPKRFLTYVKSIKASGRMPCEM